MVNYSKKKRKVRFLNFLKKIGITLTEKKPELNDKQLKMVSILRQCINNPKSELTVDLLMGSCYVELKGYYIILTQTNIDIYGGDGDYVDIHYMTGDRLLKQFYRKVSERRMEKELKYKNVKLRKLDGIINEISKR